MGSGTCHELNLLAFASWLWTQPEVSLLNALTSLSLVNCSTVVSFEWSVLVQGAARGDGVHADVAHDSGRNPMAAASTLAVKWSATWRRTAFGVHPLCLTSRARALDIRLVRYFGCVICQVAEVWCPSVSFRVWGGLTDVCTMSA